MKKIINLLLDKGSLEERQFTNWSMAYQKIKDDDIKKIVGYKDLKLDELFFTKMDERSAHPVLKVLYNFTKNLS